MSPVTSAIFDRDGTVFDSGKLIYHTLREVVLKHRKECPSFEELQRIKAPTDEEYWSILLGQRTRRWRDFEAEVRYLMRDGSSPFFVRSSDFAKITIDCSIHN